MLCDVKSILEQYKTYDYKYLKVTVFRKIGKLYNKDVGYKNKE